MSVASRLYEQHSETLQTALNAVRTRDHWSPFRESPSAKLHGEDAPRLGKARFEAQLGRAFDLDQPGTIGSLGAEVSPYTRQPSGITYPKSDPAALFAASRKAMSGWMKASLQSAPASSPKCSLPWRGMPSRMRMPPCIRPGRAM